MNGAQHNYDMNAVSLSSAWTSDQDKQLEALAGAGHSARQIGAIMQRSRNSVIGRAQRRKIALHGSRAGRAPSSIPAKPINVFKVAPHLAVKKKIELPPPVLPHLRELPRLEKVARQNAKNSANPQSIKGLQAADYAAHFSGRGVSLLNANPHHCRWPVDHRGPDGMPRCCGERRSSDASSYCPAHARRAKVEKHSNE